LAVTSLISGGRSVGIVRLGIKTTEFRFFFSFISHNNADSLQEGNILLAEPFTGKDNYYL
jgi:hypothetical protein